VISLTISGVSGFASLGICRIGILPLTSLSLALAKWPGLARDLFCLQKFREISGIAELDSSLAKDVLHLVTECLVINEAGHKRSKQYPTIFKFMIYLVFLGGGKPPDLLNVCHLID
jgi:hypothetical protein